VKDSNRRRHRPTDSQSDRLEALICASWHILKGRAPLGGSGLGGAGRGLPRSSPTSHGSGAEDINGGFSYEVVSSHEYLFYDYSTNDGHPESAYKNYKQGTVEMALWWIQVAIWAVIFLTWSGRKPQAGDGSPH
jgi:hypothetical protein